MKNLKSLLENLMKKHHVDGCDLYELPSGELAAKYKEPGEPWKFSEEVEPVNILKYEIKNNSTYGTIGIIWGQGCCSGKIYKIYLKKSKENENKVDVLDYSICE